MNLLRFLRKPEYFFNPWQLLKRFAAFARPESRDLMVKTSWGPLEVNGTETIGRSLVHMGVYDLVLTECLWRLAESNQTLIDIGANVGYFSSLLSHKTGPRGKVYSFEPHPRLFEKLQKNLGKYQQCELHNVALSEKNATMDLFVPADFEGNEGTATLEKDGLKNGVGSSIPVAVKVLDEVLGSLKVHLIKIDVEGHELSVFSGAKSVLKNTDHVLFEDFHHVNSRAIQFLRDSGFEVFRIQKTFLGPKLISVEAGKDIPLWEPPNYLATRKLAEVRAKLQPRGWKSLGY